MFLFFLLQTVNHIHKNYMYSSQLCNLLCRKQYIINIITENRNHYDYFCLSLTSSLKIETIMINFLLKLMWHSCSFMFLKVKTQKTSYFEKKQRHFRSIPVKSWKMFLFSNTKAWLFLFFCLFKACLCS